LRHNCISYKDLEQGFSTFFGEIGPWAMHYFKDETILMSLQEWRSNELGQIRGDRIKLMNLLDEAKRKMSRIKDEWAPCDLFAMAVALDQNCVRKSTNFNVSNVLRILNNIFNDRIY
jgi:hypothetical protein